MCNYAFKYTSNMYYKLVRAAKTASALPRRARTAANPQESYEQRYQKKREPR